MNSAAVALANSNQLSLPDTALPLLLAFSFSVFYRVVGCFGLSFLCAYRWLNISAFRFSTFAFIYAPSAPFCGQEFPVFPVVLFQVVGLLGVLAVYFRFRLFGLFARPVFPVSGLIWRSRISVSAFHFPLGFCAFCAFLRPRFLRFFVCFQP